MPGLALALLQLASAQATPPLPDIEFSARVRAREVSVRQEGAASLAVRVSPGAAAPVNVERSAPVGAKSYRNLTISVRASARLTDPHVSPKETQQGTIDDATPP